MSGHTFVPEKDYGHTLVLNNDWTPMSVMPLSALHWQRAIGAVMLRHVKVLHFYENWEIKSPTTSVFVPSVVVSCGPYIHFKRQVSNRYSNAFLRDDYTCQYCGTRNAALTADHVEPKSRGGSNKLTNIATACGRCNRAKGSRADIRPKTMPHMPTYYELVSKKRALPIIVPHKSWAEYIGWDESLVRIREPTGMPGYLPLITENIAT